MYPEILNLGPITIRAYGLMLAISFFVGIFMAVKRGSKYKIPPIKIIDLSLFILVSAIAGSRFFYVIYHLDEFSGHYWDIVNPFQSTGSIGIAGLSMMGGIVLVIITSVFLIKLWKMPFWQTLDVFAPAFSLGLGITRIGCFLNGCCYGNPTDWFWGVVFPQTSAAGWHFPGIHLHPAQLISSIAGFFMFGALLYLDSKKKFAGFTFLMMLVFYSAFRFIIDFFRYYETSMVFAGFGGVDFSNNQALSVLIFIISMVAVITISKSRNRDPGI